MEDITTLAEAYQFVGQFIDADLLFPYAGAPNEAQLMEDGFVEVDDRWIRGEDTFRYEEVNLYGVLVHRVGDVAVKSTFRGEVVGGWRFGDEARFSVSGMEFIVVKLNSKLYSIHMNCTLSDTILDCYTFRTCICKPFVDLDGKIIKYQRVCNKQGRLLQSSFYNDANKLHSLSGPAYINGTSERYLIDGVAMSQTRWERERMAYIKT